MSDFNPFQDQHFGGQSSLKFFTDLAPRSKMLDGFANGVANQGAENECTGEAADVVLDIFSNARGLHLDLSPSFIYWAARAIEGGNSFWGQDEGLQFVANIFRALYLRGAALQSLAPDLDASTKPSDAAFADAADRKVTLFERIDLFDAKNAIITALAHDIPVAAKFSISWGFGGITSDDPLEQMAAFNCPGGRLYPGHPDFMGFHEMPIIGYDQDLDCFFVQNSWGLGFARNGVCAIKSDTLISQLWDSYVPREFAGLTSYVDPKWIVAANERHDSSYMLNLRRYMVKVLDDKSPLTQLQKSQITRDSMPLYGATAQDLADAAAPWGVTLQVVEDFLARSAP